MNDADVPSKRKVPHMVERTAPVLKLAGSATLRFGIVFAGLPDIHLRHESGR